MRPKRGQERIKGTDTIKDAIIKLADGNPGGLTVMMQLFQTKGEDALWTIMRFDDMGLYGSDIWIAYKDVCKQDLEKLAMRAQDDQDGLIHDVRSAGGFYQAGV